MSCRILIVDGDPDFRTHLAEQLHFATGCEVIARATAHDVLELVQDGDVDIVLADTALPDIGGPELCRVLRRKRVHMPIVVMSSGTSQSEEVLSLEAGANDFVQKPIRLNVLLARLRALLRRHQASGPVMCELGRFRFDSSSRLLTDPSNGSSIRLTVKETELLKILCRSPNVAVARTELLARVWGYASDTVTHTLETHVYRLRRKLGDDRGEMLLRADGGYLIRGDGPGRSSSRSLEGTREAGSDSAGWPSEEGWPAAR